MSHFPIGRPLLKVALACIVAAPTAWAGSFYLQEQSVSGLGAANAGQSAIASDATTVASNPAGMTQLTRSQITGGGSLLLRSSQLMNDGSYAQLPASLGGARLPLNGDGRKERLHPSLIPNLFSVWAVNPDLRFGFGLTAPFGLVNKYKPEFFGRYDSQTSKLKTQNISLTSAYKISPNFSFGGGIDIQNAETTLTTAVPALANLRLLPEAQRQAYLRSIGGASGLYNAKTDGLFTVKADGWSVGGNLGLTWKPAKQWTLGLTYRSAIKHTVKGDLSVVQGSTTYRSGPAKISVTTPDIVSLGAAWQMNSRWTLLAQANHFHWRNFDKIDVKSQDTSLAVEQQNYRNSYSLALGAHYRWSDQLTLRTGTQFDRTPTVDSHRSTRVPDSNRIWLAAGAGYAISDSLSIDVAYAHLFLKDTKIDLIKDSGARIKAKQKDIASDILSIGLTYKF